MGGHLLTEISQNGTCVSEDQTQAVGMLMQKLAEPNTQFHAYYPKGLVKEKRYHFYQPRVNVQYSGVWGSG